MKARVKATGEIVEVYESCNENFPWTDEMGERIWKTEDLISLETTGNTLDYWTRLEHQAAIAAMGGICGNTSYDESSWESMAKDAISAAHTLVKKLKEERK